MTEVLLVSHDSFGLSDELTAAFTKATGWALNNSAGHGVLNADAERSRLHMICDFLPSPELIALLHAAGLNAPPVLEQDLERGFLLLGGRMADLLGRRRVFIIGLIVFAAASLAGAVTLTDVAPGATAIVPTASSWPSWPM